MSDYTALRAASLALSGLLRDAFMADPGLATLFGVNHVVSPDTPKEMRSGASPQVGLSVWLYRVERNEFTTNRPPERMAVDRLRIAPLPIDCHFLLTPITDDSLTEQAIMGKVLQVLHDSPVVRPDPARPELRDELRIFLENLDLESITRVWNALDQPYELCASYLVQVVNIDTGEQPVASSPVVDRRSEYDQVVSAP